MDTNKAPTALITGANRGIGREVAQQLDEKGYQVISTSRNPQKSPSPGKCIQLDLLSDDSIELLASSLKGTTVDVLIQNAGIYLENASSKSARWETMQSNIIGPMRLFHALLPQLSSGAKIIMISSGMGEISGLSRQAANLFSERILNEDELYSLLDEYTAGSGFLGAGPYSVSKAAVNMAVKHWTQRYPQYKFLSVCPGWVKTDMGGQNAPRTVQQGAETIVWAATTTEPVPWGKFVRDKREIRW